MRSASKRCWPIWRAAAVEGAQGPRLLIGTGAQQTHLLLVCTGERGLCGAFNTSIVRLAREKANALIGEGKTVKIICVGKKGYDQLRRTFERQIIDFVDLRAVRTLGYANAQPIAKKRSRTLRGGRVRRLHFVFRALQVGHRADADRPAVDPARIREIETNPARPTTTSPTRARFSRSCCRTPSRCASIARCWKTWPRSTARR